MRFWVLGRVELQDAAGRPIEPLTRQPKRLALLAYLAAAGPGFHSREILQALLWPELDTDRARNALVQSIHFLRRHLGPDAVVNRGRGDVGVDPDRVWCDAAAFERDRAQGRLAEAVELYRGDLLPGFHVSGAAEEFERWLEDERGLLRRRAAQAAWRLCSIDREAENLAGAAYWARRALRIEPEDEEGLRRLLELLDQAGDRMGALRAYEKFARRLDEEFGVAPAVETEALVASIRGRSSLDRPGPPRETASVAVLPFLSLGTPPDADWFADGLTEELIASLANVGGLKVASRTSSFAFKQTPATARTIGERLGVRSIVEGSVRWAGNRVRITAQLIDVTQDIHLWAETYERAAEDLFAIQADVAARIADALSVTFTDAERRRIHGRRSESLEAYALYLQGRQLRARGSIESLRAAAARFDEAAGVDPAFALAHAAKAESRLALALVRFAPALHRRRLLDEAGESVERALELEPDLAEARVTSAFLRWYDWDWAASERELRRALALAPQLAAAHHRLGIELAYLSRFDEAREALERAHDLDPMSLEIMAHSALPSLRERRYDEAVARLRSILAIEPRYEPAIGLLGEAYRYGGRIEQHIDLFESVHWLSAEEAAEVREALRRGGEAEHVRAMLPYLERLGASPVILATAHMRSGHEPEAWAFLERGFDERDPALTDGIRNHPGFDVFRGLARFEEVARAMGVDPAETRLPAAAQRSRRAARNA